MRRVRDTHAETNYSESVRMPRVRRRRSRAEETQHTLAEREKWGNLFLVWMFWIRLSPFIPLSIPHTHLCKRKRQETSFVTEACLRFVANVVPRLLSPFKSRALFFLRRLLLLQNENKEKTNRYRNSVWKDRRKGRRPWNPSGRYGRVPRPVFFPLSFLSSSLFRLSPLSAAGRGVNGAWSMGFNTVYIYIYIYLWGLWWHHHPREVDAADCFRLLSFSFLFFPSPIFLFIWERRGNGEKGGKGRTWPAAGEKTAPLLLPLLCCCCSLYRELRRHSRYQRKEGYCVMKPKRLVVSHWQKGGRKKTAAKKEEEEKTQTIRNRQFWQATNRV